MTAAAMALMERARERVVKEVVPSVRRGFALPFSVFSKMRADPVVRGIYMRTTMTQLVVVGLGIALFWPGWLNLVWFAQKIGDVKVNGVIAGGQALALAGATLYATLCSVEWTVLWLWKDHNDVLQCELGALAGVPTDERPERPRVRIDLGWLKRRLFRQAKGWVLFVFPVLFLFPLGMKIDGWSLGLVGSSVQHGLTFLWGAYWAAVLCAGKSHLAWKREAGAPPFSPWYLRTWDALLARIPWLCRRRLVVKYGNVWKRFSSGVAGPQEALERMPREYGGLFLARMLAAIPVVSIFLRPVISIAATQLLLEQRRGAR